MKLFTVALLVCVSHFSFASSKYVGPYIVVEMNLTSHPPTPPKKIICVVTPGKVTITKYSNPTNGSSTSKEVNINSNELSKAILSASKEPYVKIAMHKKVSNPSLLITAGIAPEVRTFDIYEDASNISKRSGKDASDLIKQAKKTCGSLSF